MERRLAAILAADAVGYSRLMSEDEEATLSMLNAYRGIVDGAIESHRGRIFGSAGDSVVAEFVSPVEAVRCAVEIQRGLRERNADVPEDRRMHFRIGVNLGDVMAEADNLLGEGVNIAARLEGLADPGGICVSRAVHDQVQDKLDLAFDDLGEIEVKNIARPVRVYRVGSEAEAEGKPSPAGSRKKPVLFRMAALVAAALVIAGVGGFGLWQWMTAPEQTAKAPSDGVADVLAMPTGPSIVVLPFDNMSDNPEQEFFSDGITEEIITALSRFSQLHVLARNTAFQYKDQAVDIGTLARETGVEYVLEGSVRRAADTIRVTAQLVEARSGVHLWAETYEREITPAIIFAVQDDIATKVAAAVAPAYGGAISNTRLQAVNGKPPESLSSYECVLETMGIWRGQAAALVTRSRDCLALAVKRDPGYADAWAMLARVYLYQRWYGWGLEPPESNDLQQRAYLAQRGLAAAQKAVNLAPDSALANMSLSMAYWAAGELDKFQAQAERALALNANDPNTLGPTGVYLAFSGWWDDGVAMVRKAIALAPKSYAKWWLWAIAKDHFHKGEYEQALATFERAFIPGFWLSQLQLSYTHGMLGNTKQAAKAVARLQELMPGLSIGEALAYYRMWNFQQSYLDRMADGLRRAGLPE